MEILHFHTFFPIRNIKYYPTNTANKFKKTAYFKILSTNFINMSKSYQKIKSFSKYSTFFLKKRGAVLYKVYVASWLKYYSLIWKTGYKKINLILGPSIQRQRNNIREIAACLLKHFQFITKQSVTSYRKLQIYARYVDSFVYS